MEIPTVLSILMVFLLVDPRAKFRRSKTYNFVHGPCTIYPCHYGNTTLCPKLARGGRQIRVNAWTGAHVSKRRQSFFHLTPYIHLHTHMHNCTCTCTLPANIPAQIEAICQSFDLGDWFLLYQLGKNIDPIIFR